MNELVGTVCTVLSEENELLFLGTITQMDEEHQSIRVEKVNDGHGLWREVPENTIIKILIQPRRHPKELTIIDGVARTATRMHLTARVTEIRQKENSRNHFRQNVRRNGMVSQVNGKRVEHECEILNVSGTGIAIQSRVNYEIGDELHFCNQQFREDGPLHSVDFKVVRMNANEDGEWVYGCQFTQLSEQEEDKLFSDIFALQANELHKERQEQE